MILSQDASDALFQIRAYQPGFITVNENTYTHSLIVSPQQLMTDWPPQSLAALTPADWSAVLAMNPTVILLGTGRQFTMPHPRLLAPVYERKIGIESMDTASACRTYTALAAEGRRVLAALLID
jgi:uncharacterized protein